MRRLRVVEEARRELMSAARHYERERRGLGEELRAEIQDVLEQIAAAPDTFARWRHDKPYRKALARRFPYVVFFLDLGDEVRVLAVAHCSRKPGYWTRRGSR